MAEVLDCSPKVSKFEPQLHYYIHFWTTTLKKSIELSYPCSNGLNSITAVLQQEWFWHRITHKSWYAIKQRTQNKPIDGTLTSITTLFQSGPGSNDNEKVTHTPQSSRTGASPPDTTRTPMPYHVAAVNQMKGWVTCYQVVVNLSTLLKSL